MGQENRRRVGYGRVEEGPGRGTAGRESTRMVANRRAGGVASRVVAWGNRTAWKAGAQRKGAKAQRWVPSRSGEGGLSGPRRPLQGIVHEGTRSDTKTSFAVIRRVRCGAKSRTGPETVIGVGSRNSMGLEGGVHHEG